MLHVVPAGILSFPSGGYTIENAIYLDGSSDYLDKDFFVAGTEETWACSFWLKGFSINTTQYIFASRIDGNNTGYIEILSGSGNQLQMRDYNDGVAEPAYQVKTSAVLRDPTAWYHFLCVMNSSNSTSTERQRIYINGVRQEASSPTYSGSSYASAVGINSANRHYIGQDGNNANDLYGYMAEFVFVDGSTTTTTVDSENKLTNNELGEFDSKGVWVPKNPSTNIDDFGTNGFYLKFDAPNLLGKSSNSTTNPTVSHLGSEVQTSAQQTHTITAALGTAVSNRSIVIAVGGGRNNPGTRSVSTLTLEDSGGTPRNATFIARKNSGAGNVTEFWYIAAGTSFGTSGEIVVTYTGGDNNMITCGISWWRVLDAGQPISTNSNTGSSWSTQAVTTIGQTGDVAFYAIYDEGNADAYAWSDATERSEHIDITSTRSFTSADYTFDAAESHTETATISGGQGNDNGFLGVTFSNNNSFASNSMAAANKVTDTPTDDADNNIGNYCTWNPVCDFSSAKVSLSNGNTTATITPDGAILGTQFFDVTDSDGFYWETKFTSNISNAEHAGIGQETVPLQNTGYRDNGIATYLSDGGSEGTASGSLGTTGNRAAADTHDTWQSNNDIISVAVKGGAIWFAKNNVWQDGANGGASSATVLSEINAGTTTNAFFTGLTGFWTPMVRGHSGSATPSTTNWGATAFTYTPPTNMKRLMTANRSAPTIKNPDDGFALITLENGNTIEASLANARTGWGSFIDVFKREDATDEDYDVRFSDDSGNSMHFNTNAAAGSEATLASGVNYSAWSWRVGSTYGCYTAEISHDNTSATNQAHGLGSGAKSAVAKRSDSTGDWYVSHPNLSSANIRFNVQEVTTSELVTVDDTNVTLSTSFASGTYRVIVWKQIDGFSAFTKYDHNGSTSDGPYVHLGGSASLVAWRNIDSSNSNDFFPTFTNYSTNGNGNPTDIRYNWSNGEKGSSGITIGDVTANGYKMRPSSGGAFGSAADDPMLVWAWGIRPFGGDGVAQARAR